jgi:hypothetical protein
MPSGVDHIRRTLSTPQNLKMQRFRGDGPDADLPREK